MASYKEQRYFIALIPPKEVCTEVLLLKQYIANNYSSKGALRSEAHITLHMPFMWADKRLPELRNALTLAAHNTSPFLISAKNFDFFVPRVIFIRVQPSEPLVVLQSSVIKTMRSELNLNNANYKDSHFHPHITIGFRDLKKRDFMNARPDFEGRSFEQNWIQKDLSLLKWDGERWSTFENYRFVQ